MPEKTRDIYGRRPISQSRGKTQQRIMDLQHAAGEVPGIENELAAPPDGSIASAFKRFLVEWVETRPLTSRRTYERTLMMLVKDLESTDLSVNEPVLKLTADRLEKHLEWRISQGLDDAQELLRTGVHLARIGEWCDEHENTSFGDLRDRFRAAAANLTA